MPLLSEAGTCDSLGVWVLAVRDKFVFELKMNLSFDWALKTQLVIGFGVRQSKIPLFLA